MTTLDPTTGLPELPDGIFWRITDRGRKLRIELRQQALIGSWLIRSQRISPTPESALWGAALIVEWWNDLVDTVHLLGDYPPKKRGTP